MTRHDSHTTDGIPLLVAHRGYTARYPENTLPGCEAALQAGACYLEIDIQLTADAVPVLCHDHNLLRTTGHDALITDTRSQQLHRLDAAERQRLGNALPPTAIPTLYEFVELLQQWPQAQAFIEIKEESLEVFGLQKVTRQVLDALAPVQARCILISYNADILRSVRQQGDWSTGWVLHDYDQASRDSAHSWLPDYLICNYRKVGDAPLWPGPWQWVLYEITDAKLALELYHRGAQMIETMTIGDLLQDPVLARGRCSPTAP